MAQAIHGAFLFAKNHPEVTHTWLEDSQYLIVVSVPSESDILEIEKKALTHNLKYSIWSEPDLDNEITAIALAPGSTAARLCSNLPLAGKASIVTI
jgi:peptidyl-tRNA hydrolase